MHFSPQNLILGENNKFVAIDIDLSCKKINGEVKTCFNSSNYPYKDQWIWLAINCLSCDNIRRTLKNSVVNYYSQNSNAPISDDQKALNKFKDEGLTI